MSAPQQGGICIQVLLHSAHAREGLVKQQPAAEATCLPDAKLKRLLCPSVSTREGLDGTTPITGGQLFSRNLFCPAAAVSRRQRTFSHAGAALQAAWMALYLALCLAIKHVNGKYPYDFMNELPEPQGMLLATVVLTGAVTITYYAARYGLATRFAEQHTQTLKHQ